MMKIPEKEKVKLEAIIQYANIGILIVNESGMIVQINPHAENLFKYEKDELLGKKIETLIPKRFSKKHEGYREKYNESPCPRIMGEQSDLFAMRKDGTEFPVDINLSPYSTRQGNFVVAFIMDITIRKEKEFIINQKTKELSEINKELEKINKDLIALMYVSSHDLQEPLRKIRSFMSILLKEEKEKLSDDGKRYLEKTYETAKRMQTLIEDLLVYFRTKNIEKNFLKTDLNTIVDEVIKDFEELIKEKNAIIKVDKLCEVDISPLQFRQVIQNLISNALKFSHSERPPHISIKSEIIPGSKLNNEHLSSNIKYCHLIISDNGIGFDPQYRNKIFEVFQRLNEYSEYKGTGIGLAICKRIIENHNGIITATGKINEGAQFDIYIPAE